MATNSLHVNRDIILATKRQSLMERRRTIPLDSVLALAQMQRRPRDILNIMQEDNAVTLLGQITRTEIYDPVTTGLAYVREGVDGLLFFTDHSIYGGDFDDMLLVARGVKDTPIIYQNYIFDEYGVLSARAADASGVMVYGSLLDLPSLRRVVGTAQRNKMTVLLQIEVPESLELVHTLSPHVVAYGDPLYGRLAQSVKELQDIRSALPTYTRLMLMHPLQTIDEVAAALSVRVHALILGDAILNHEKRLQQVRQMIQTM